MVTGLELEVLARLYSPYELEINSEVERVLESLADKGLVYRKIMSERYSVTIEGSKVIKAARLLGYSA